MTPKEVLYFALFCLWAIVVIGAVFEWANRRAVAAGILGIALVGFSLLPFRENLTPAPAGRPVRLISTMQERLVGLAADPKQEYHRADGCQSLGTLVEFPSEAAARSEGRTPCPTCFGTKIAQTPR